MKKKTLSVLFLTLVIAGMGAGMLLWSTNWIMAEAQEDVASTEEIVATEEERTEMVKSLNDITVLEDALREATGEVAIELPAGITEEQEIEMLQKALLAALEEREEHYEELSIATAEFVYYGQSVSIKDDMLEKETISNF